MIDLSVVILTYRTPDLLMDCLAALAQNPLTVGTSETLVVDNASGDDTLRRVAERYPYVRLHANAVNLGFAGGNNRGIAGCHSRYLLLLNPDTRVSAGALDALVSFMDETPDAGAAGGQLIGLEGEIQTSCRRFPSLLAVILRGTPLHRLFPNHPSSRHYLISDWDHQSIRRVDWALGACLILRREAWDQVGSLDEGFFMYYEDIDWCYRAYQAGWSVYYVPSAKVLHHHRRESARGLLNRLTLEHIRSIIRLFRKHRLPWR